MSKVFCLCSVLLAIVAGCSKEEPPPAPTEPPPESPPAAVQPAAAPVVAAPQSPAPVAPPVAKPAPQPRLPSGVKPLEGRVDAYMTSLLKRFVAQKGRMPQSVLELAGATSDSFPLAPAGFIYAIDAATTEVKLVKQ
jgi:hypothetical protein